MKIHKIKLNSHPSASRNVYTDTGCSLFLFKVPVIMDINGEETALSCSSAVLLDSGSKLRFRSPADKRIRFDTVTFTMDPADSRYISELSLPFDTPIKIRDDFILSSTIRSMNIRYLEKGRLSGEFFDLAMRMIFITLFDAYIPTESAVTNQIPRCTELKELRNAIYAKPERQWSVDEISAEMGISRVYFHRLYFKAFGVSCLRDVIESRLIRSCTLLSTTSLSISSIAERCGYESDSYFMRQFKKYKNCTPSEYRKRSAETNNSRKKYTSEAFSDEEDY